MATTLPAGALAPQQTQQTEHPAVGIGRPES